MSRNDRTDYLDGEAGMTLVEILVSATILFIILTGLLGLVGQSTNMAVQAKHKNVVTNALSGYTEWLHSLPFDEVNTSGGLLDPANPRFAEAHNYPVKEFQVSISPTVSPGASVYLKEVSISVTVTRRADGQARTMSTMVVVRDRNQHLTEGDRSPEKDPVAEIIHPTPPDGATVWGGSIPIEVRATAAEGRTIDQVFMYVGGKLLYGTGTGGVTVSEWFAIDEAVTVRSFNWDSLATDLKEDGTYEVRYPSGWRTVSIIVYDDVGSMTMATRRFYVDNDPPGEPGKPMPVENPSRPDLTITWEVPSGPEPAYEFELRRQGSAQDGYHSPFDDVDPWNGGHWEQVGPETTYSLSGTPFSRYIARVFAKTPRYDLGFEEYRSEWVEGDVFMTRPLLYGTYSVSSNRRVLDVSLSVTPPTFPTTGEVTFSYYRIKDGTIQEIYRGPLSTYTDSIDAGPGNRVSSYSYTVQVTYTPVGFEGGSQTTINSNTVTTGTNSGNYTFTEGSW